MRVYVLGCAPTDWVAKLGLCERCLNSHVSVSTGYSPDELTFGQVLPEPLDVALGGVEAPAATEAAREVRAKMALARQHIARAQAWQKAHADKRRSELEFPVGSQVLLSAAHLP